MRNKLILFIISWFSSQCFALDPLVLSPQANLIVHAVNADEVRVAGLTAGQIYACPGWFSAMKLTWYLSNTGKPNEGTTCVIDPSLKTVDEVRR